MKSTVATALAIFGVLFLLMFLWAIPVMFLWNWICPELFGLATVSYWQAWGLVVLIHLLWPSGSNTSK